MTDYLQFDARLVEEAVLLAIAGHPEERTFRKMRDRVYQIEDGEEREERFQSFHGRWFTDLKLGRPVETALGEQPSLIERTRLCAVAPAVSAQDEGADLHGFRKGVSVESGVKPAIIITLRPVSFLNGPALLRLLRHELMHTADMLDPQFGYESVLPHSDFGSSHDNLVRERYRVLWDTWIDGRLERRGWASPGVREKRWAQYREAFTFLGAEAQKEFDGLCASDTASHRAFVEFARNPAGSGNRRPVRDGKPLATSCPLCRFPTYQFADGANLSSGALREIAADYPEWRPEHGLCAQCAELYRSRWRT